MGKNKIYGLIFFTVFLLMHENSFSQTQVYNVTGQVIDKNNNNPIEGTWVSVLDLEHDLIISKIQTKPDGHFEISFKKGKYSISFSSEKYETLMLPVNYSDFKDNVQTIGNIRLKPLSYIQLNEVTVTAKDFRLENVRGKKIYHIGNSLKDIAGSMSNLLSYIPSVFVDIDGKIQLRGREPIIMINGRKSNLSKSDVLQMLPGDMVKKIEITTSPSARDGETEPIINIITEKKKKGLIGGVNLSVGAPSTLKGGLHLAVNKEKINGYGLYGVKKESDIKTFSNEFLENKNENSNYQERESSNSLTNSMNHFGEIQYEYLPSKNSELVGSISIYTNDNKFLYTGSRMTEENSILTNKINQLSDNSVKTFSISKEIEYEIKFNKNKDLFKVELEYEYEERKKNENFAESASNQTQTNTSQSYDKYKGDEMKLKMRFDKTLRNNAYFTIGYRLDRNLINQDQTFETNILESISLKNNIKYTQYDHTGFVDYSNKFEGIYYNLGVRLKNTNRVLKDNITGQNSKRSFLNLLPTINLSYEYGNKNEISLNYYNLLSQPRLSYLNSFNTSTNLQRVRIGNPNLEPQNTHALELAYLKEFKDFTLNTTVYSKLTTGIIQDITTFDDENNIAISIPENIGKAKTFGIDFSYSLSSPGWLNTIIKLNGSYGKILNDETASNEIYALNTSFINIVKLNSYKLELSWFYNSPKQINYQIREESNQYFKTGLSKSIIKGKGNLALSVIDPFNSGRKIQRINGTNYNYRNEFNPNQRRISLSLFIRFSTKSKFRKTEKEVEEKGILQ